MSRQTVTLIGDSNTSDQFNLYFEGKTRHPQRRALMAAQVQTALGLSFRHRQRQ